MPNPAELSTLCDFPKDVCRNPVNLCCKWDHDPFVKRRSPTEKCDAWSAGHLRSRTVMIDPETGVLFPLTVLPPQPKKGAAVSPLNCRVKIPENQPDRKNTHFNPYFFSAWTPFSLSEKTLLSVCQKEHFTGLFEIRSCLHLHHTSWSLPYAGPGQMGNHSHPLPKLHHRAGLRIFIKDYSGSILDFIPHFFCIP